MRHDKDAAFVRQRTARHSLWPIARFAAITGNHENRSYKRLSFATIVGLIIFATLKGLIRTYLLKKPLDKSSTVGYHARQCIKGIGTKGNEAV